jgi:hypothetical protein
MLERSLFLAIRHHPRKIGGDVAQINVTGSVGIPATIVRLCARAILDSRLGEAARSPAVEGAVANGPLSENAARDLVRLDRVPEVALVLQTFGDGQVGDERDEAWRHRNNAVLRSLALDDDELDALEVAAAELQVAGFRTSQAGVEEDRHQRAVSKR